MRSIYTRLEKGGLSLTQVLSEVGLLEGAFSLRAVVSGFDIQGKHPGLAIIGVLVRAERLDDSCLASLVRVIGVII